MYERIVVPLDGSKLAECVLPYAEELANGCDTREIILVSVTENIVGYRAGSGSVQAAGTVPPPEPVTKVAVAVGKKQGQAERYLARVAKRLKAKDTKVRTEVLLGNPAHEIADFAQRNRANLIIMASHGRSGLTRWAFGSVADRVFRASSVPVMMVKAPGSVPGS